MLNKEKGVTQMDELKEMLLQLLHERYPGDIPAFIKDLDDLFA